MYCNKYCTNFIMVYLGFDVKAKGKCADPNFFLYVIIFKSIQFQRYLVFFFNFG